MGDGGGLLDAVADRAHPTTHTETVRGRRSMAAHKPSLNLTSRIADLRQGCQVSQKELAKAVGVSENTIASWERSIPGSFLIAFDICDYFEEEIEAFFNGDEVEALKNIETLRNKFFDGPISQRELAQEIDVTENTISTWETGKHKTVQKLEKLCHSLNCSVSDLYEQYPESKSIEAQSRKHRLPVKFKRSPHSSAQVKVLTVRVPVCLPTDISEI